ncbi:MAG: hypothetical protein BroJett025_10970 [Patescibacteria group bacterium]|nr:MAG: hypothetical protein BroJett025_10970 [Patescibacteria group bacterium]
MKQLFLTFLLLLSIEVGVVTQKVQLTSTVYAQEPIELNFGDVADEREIIGTDLYEPDDGEAGFGALIGRILTIVVTIASIMVLIMFLWGGLEWITAGGDKSKIEKARNRITQSFIGMIVLAAMLALFMLLQLFLDFEVFTFGGGSSNTSTPPSVPGNPSQPGWPGAPGGNIPL